MKTINSGCLVLMMMVAHAMARGMEAVMAKCEKSLLRQNFQNYLARVHELGHDFCTHMKFAMDEELQEPSCRGEAVTGERMWLLQIIIMSNKMGTCEINYRPLMNLVKHSPHYHLIVKLHSLDHDKSQACAEKVQRTCIAQYMEEIQDNPDYDICKSYETSDDCYRNGASHCDAKILKDYADIVEKLGGLLLDLYKKTGVC